MKRILVLMLGLNISYTLNLLQAESDQNPKISPQSQSYEDNTPETLGRIAAIISFFSNVVANPNDHKNVATSILGIISTIFTIAADTRQINFNYLELQDEIMNILQTGNQEQIANLQDMIKDACELQIQNLETYIKTN